MYLLDWILTDRLACVANDLGRLRGAARGAAILAEALEAPLPVCLSELTRNLADMTTTDEVKVVDREEEEVLGLFGREERKVGIEVGQIANRRISGQADDDDFDFASRSLCLEEVDSDYSSPAKFDSSGH